MHITCPACATAYKISDRLMRPGRRARCAKCGEEWVPFDDSAEIPPAPPLPKTLAPATESSSPAGLERLGPPLLAAERDGRDGEDAPERPPPHPAIWLGWALSLAVVGFALWGATHDRARVMTTWPPSERLYGALGLTPKPH